jgi:hypothetical protein
MAAASPEESASCLSRLTFSWLSPLLDIGKDRPLEFADLPPLSADTRARELAEQFAEHWRAQLALQPAAPSLVAAFEPMYRRDFVICGALKLVADALTLLTPVLLAWLITFIAESQPTMTAPAPPLYAGVLIAVGMLLATLGTTVISNWYFRVMMNMGLNVRSVLITAMYRKALKLSPAARADMSTGQIINMVSTDASRLDVMMGFVHYLCTQSVSVLPSHVCNQPMHTKFFVFTRLADFRVKCAPDHCLARPPDLRHGAVGSRRCRRGLGTYSAPEQVHDDGRVASRRYCQGVAFFVSST